MIQLPPYSPDVNLIKYGIHFMSFVLKRVVTVTDPLQGQMIKPISLNVIALFENNEFLKSFKEIGSLLISWPGRISRLIIQISTQQKTALIIHNHLRWL